jgi:hypothetical protein
MARFFFDFRQGAQHWPDAEGAEFAHVEEAYLQAVRGVEDMWGELLHKRQDPRRCAFEVRNQERELLFVLPFQEVLDSCLDRKCPSIQTAFDDIVDSAHRTKRVSEGVLEALHAVRMTLAQSRALLDTKI